MNLRGEYILPLSGEERTIKISLGTVYSTQMELGLSGFAVIWEGLAMFDLPIMLTLVKHGLVDCKLSQEEILDDDIDLKNLHDFLAPQLERIFHGKKNLPTQGKSQKKIKK